MKNLLFLVAQLSPPHPSCWGWHNPEKEDVVHQLGLPKRLSPSIELFWLVALKNVKHNNTTLDVNN